MTRANFKVSYPNLFRAKDLYFRFSAIKSSYDLLCTPSSWNHVILRIKYHREATKNSFYVLKRNSTETSAENNINKSDHLAWQSLNWVRAQTCFQSNWCCFRTVTKELGIHSNQFRHSNTNLIFSYFRTWLKILLFFTSICLPRWSKIVHGTKKQWLTTGETYLLQLNFLHRFPKVKEVGDLHSKRKFNWW